MIEHLRKYSGLIIVVFAILLVAFVLGGYTRNLKGSSAGGMKIIKVDGISYTDTEVHRQGKAALDLTYALANAGDFSLYQFIMPMMGQEANGSDPAENFFVSRMILKDAREKFGIYPGEDEISDTIRGMRAFAGPDGKFSEENYRNFIEKGIGHMGLAERDLRELAADMLVSKKLNAVLGSGLLEDKKIAELNLALQNQQITAELAHLDVTPFREKISPTDDELKTYWETIQESFTTQPRRKFSYFIAKPEAPADAGEEPAAPGPDATDEEKAAATKAAEERKAAAAEDKRKKQQKLNAAVDDFIYQLGDQKGIGFEELAKQNGWEIQTTDFFTQAEPPAELGVSLRSSSQPGKASDILFQIQPIDSDPASKISPAIPIGDDAWLVARLDGEEKSRVKTFDEAKEDARTGYINENAADAMKKAAEEALAKIKDSLAAGKTFEEAATDAGLGPVKKVANITSSYRPDPLDEPQNLFQSLRNIDPGTVADLNIQTDHIFIPYVAKREVVKKADADTSVQNAVSSATSQNEFAAFTAWLNERTETAHVQLLNRR
ncbi:peptidylprolyl isomerase [Luteolibacter pohnpeiensis]|uniref:Peptidylprolyl isomerase n=1 Tax=Luteolibacter pohnpeiensis TaxID=454153 RepID=A0A934S2T6_9BACT|nr:peptidylprolyl isomerase [Luteolibacter pohnpeiensis]MBK1881297.1 peptidylprolyl isomerase [Luteolibacter pohnpeiensis]